jgi:hypothetical protein
VCHWTSSDELLNSIYVIENFPLPNLCNYLITKMWLFFAYTKIHHQENFVVVYLQVRVKFVFHFLILCISGSHTNIGERERKGWLIHFLSYWVPTKSNSIVLFSNPPIDERLVYWKALNAACHLFVNKTLFALMSAGKEASINSPTSGILPSVN